MPRAGGSTNRGGTDVHGGLRQADFQIGLEGSEAVALKSLYWHGHVGSLNAQRAASHGVAGLDGEPDAGAAAFRMVAPGSVADRTVLFEQVNAPEIMSPWEIRCHIDYLLAQVREGATRDAVAARAKAQFNLPNESLLLNCSHTHCGPELKFTDAEFVELNDPVRKERCLRYNATLVEKITRMIGDAISKLEPVTLSYAHARCGFAMNRRLKNDKPFGEPYLVTLHGVGYVFRP